MSRYRAEGPIVYQGEAQICLCSVGDQGQKPEAIAARIAALLEADFIRFCMSAAGATRTHGTTLPEGPPL